MSSMTGHQPVSLLLYCSAHWPDEVLVPVLLFQFFPELRRKRRPKPGLTGNEQSLGLGGAKPDRIAAASAKHGTANAALNTFCLQPGCVIEVPVSVDRLLDRVGIDARRSFRNTGRARTISASTTSSHQAGKHGNVSAQLEPRAGICRITPLRTWTSDNLLIRRKRLR